MISSFLKTKLLRITLIGVASGFIMISAAQSAEAALSKKVIGNLAYWDQARGFQNIQNNIGVFSEVTVHWHTINANGQVVPYLNGSGNAYIDPSIISYLHSNNVLVTASIENIVNGDWNGQVVSQIINNPALMDAHINNIVNMVVTNGFDGTDIDYENLVSTDRAAFSKFIQDLAAALHAKNKILAVDVYSKTSEPGHWSSPQAQDWAAIGSAADQVRIMNYGYSWGGSAPGPLAPISWVNDVLAFAVTKIPADKVIHGIPTYGNDWPSGQRGTEYMWDKLISFASTYNATINWDATSMSPWFAYTANGVPHTAWFENSTSTNNKLNLTKYHNLGGIFVWRLGGEDPATWQVVASQFGALPASANIKANGSDGPITIPPGTSATISWTSQNAASCSVSPAGWTGLSNPGISTGILTASVTYTLACTGLSGTVSDSVTVATQAPVSDTQAPLIVIIEPTEESTLARRQKISVNAVDNIGITKVEFLFDGKLITADTSNPYFVYVNLNKVASGPHIIRVVAYDAAGNTGISQITAHAP